MLTEISILVPSEVSNEVFRILTGYPMILG